VVGDGAIAVFRIGSFAAGARLVQAIAAAAGDAGPHHPDVDLQRDTVTVRLLWAASSASPTWSPARGQDGVAAVWN
jgi:4a-hydroxytetrahydrobiopterin dehydratase